MKIKQMVCIITACLPVNMYAQGGILSLKECIDIGLTNNLQIKSVEQDVRQADVTRSENRSRLLPVIQAFGSFIDNVHRGTTVTDGSGISQLLGMDVPYMKNQGLQYATQGGLQAQLPIYDQTLYIGLGIADKMKEISLNSLGKAREDLVMQIAQLYYLAQTTQEQIRLVNKNIRSLEGLDSISQAMRDNGMVLEVDVKRVSISLSNLRVQRDNALATYEQQLNLLRYVLDLPPKKSLYLEPLKDWEERLNHINYSGISQTLYELQAIDLQKQLAEKQRKQIRAGYLPTLTLVGNLSYANYTDRFRNYFHNHPSNKWYNTTYWGLQLNIPIFDRFSKRNAVRKADAGIEKLSIARESTQKQLETQYLNGLNDWENNKRSMATQRENYQLAEEVYNVALDQYKEGVTSMSVLLQDEMSMSEAQNAYINTVYKYLISELTLLKLTGQLDQLMK